MFIWEYKDLKNYTMLSFIDGQNMQCVAVAAF